MIFVRVVGTKQVPRLIWDIVTPVAADGASCELFDFLENLPAAMHGSRRTILAMLAHVAGSQAGPRKLSDARSHQVGKSPQIWEFIQGDIRILYFYGEERRVVVCACGFIKSGQKTPLDQKKKAIDLRNTLIKNGIMNIIDEFEKP